MSDSQQAITPKKTRSRPNTSNQNFVKIKDQISQSSRTSSRSNEGSNPHDTMMTLSISECSSIIATDSVNCREIISQESSVQQTSSSVTPNFGTSAASTVPTVESTLNGSLLTSLDLLHLANQVAIPSPLTGYTLEELHYFIKLQIFAPFGERPDFFMKVRPFIKFNYYKPGDIILVESSLRLEAHWIIEGSLIVTRTIQFKNDNGVLSEHNSDLDLAAEIVNVTIDTQELHAGDNTGVDSVCGHGVRSDSNAITASVSVEVLNAMVTTQIRLLLDASSSVYNFSNDFLVREYLENEEYERHRKIVQSHTVEGNSLEYLNKAV